MNVEMYVPINGFVFDSTFCPHELCTSFNWNDSYVNKATR